MGTKYTMPTPGGRITAISCYAATFTGTATPNLCIWDSSGNLLAHVAAGSSVSAGSPAWVSGTLGTPLFVVGGTLIYIGWSDPTANGFYAKFDNTGDVLHWGYNTSPPGSLGTNTTPSGSIGAYATYTPGGVAYVNTGTPASPVWTQGVVFVNTGTPAAPVWTPVSGISVNTGTPAAPVWTPGS